MPDEEALVKTSFVDKLVQEKTERQKSLVLAKAKKKQDRKDMLSLASLERFLAKKLDFKGDMDDLRALDARELERVRKLVLGDAKRKCVLFGLPCLGIVFSSFVIPLGDLLSFSVGVVLGTTFMTILLPHLWFIFTGHYLGFYCEDCIKKRGTSKSCYCDVGWHY